MSFIYGILGYPLGWIMYVCYNIFHNYGLALIVFTILTKAIMVPMSIKQQKSMAKMAAVRPEMEEIQKKYKSNPAKMQDEMTKLYARENYSPLSGCLPMLIQFPILFGLIDVIYYPLKHILRFTPEVIAKATEITTSLGESAGGMLRSAEIAIISAVEKNPDAFAIMGEDFISKVQGFDFTFMGINLGEVPSFAFNILLLVPILSFITSIMASLVSMKMTNANMGENQQAKSMNFSMLIMMPVMSAYISFTVPAGVGMYWVLSNVLMAVQSAILYKIYNPVEMAQKAKEEAEARRELERQEKIEAKKRLKDGDESAREKALSQKEINSMRLAAARKRMEERYGVVETVSDEKDPQ